VLVRQAGQRDARDEGSIAERQRVAGAIRENQEQGNARHAVHQGGQDLLGRGVDPVQVLDDYDLGPARRRLGQQPTDGVQRLAVSLLRAHGGHRRVPGVHGEQGP
jgi:hypothetical protein